MAFPFTALPSVVEVKLGGAWVDITSATRGENTITITRGSANEQQKIGPSRCTLALNNRDGAFSPRNPLGTYYGRVGFGRNTEIRVRVNEQMVTPSLRGAVEVAESAGPSVLAGNPAGAEPGDLLIAWHSFDQGPTTDEWAAPTPGAWELLTSAYSDMTNDLITRVWTKRFMEGESPAWAFDQAATADGVVIIAAIKDASFADVVCSSVTVEPVPGASFATPGITPATDADFELRYVAGTDSVGLAGATFTPPATYTERADAQSGNFTIASLATKPLTSGAATGTATFTCSTASMDIAHGVTIAVMPDVVRYHGEVESWPSRWDTSGTDVYVTLAANGPLKRLGQGQSPVRSAIYRGILDEIGLDNLVAYWPLEDGEDATSFANLVPGGRPMRPIGTVTAAGGSQAGAATSPVVSLDTNGQVRGLTKPLPGRDKWTIGALFNFSAEPDAIFRAPLSWTTDGTIRQWYLIGNAASNRLTVEGYNSAGSLVTTQFVSTTAFNIVDTWVYLYVTATFTSPGNFSYDIVISDGITTTTANQTGAGEVGSVTSLMLSHGGGAGSSSVGHAIVTVRPLMAEIVADPAGLISGHAGETAAARIRRLAAQEGLAVEIIGNEDASAPVGPQRVATLLDLIQDAADADQGILYEPRSFLGLAYRTRSSLYNQDPVLELDYSLAHLSNELTPIDDDQLIRNDVEVKRLGGSSGYAIKTTGPLSILPPDEGGVGRYDEAPTLNLYTDSQADQVAGWRLGLGTWDEERYPVVSVMLQRAPFRASPTLTRAAARLDVGDRFTIANTPAWLPPGDINQLMRGSTERLTNKGWQLDWNAVPAGPYSVAVLDDDVLGKLESAGTLLVDGATGSATTFEARVTAGPIWTTAAGEFPFDVTVAGEQMTVTDIDDSPVTFGVAGAAAHANNANVTPGIPAGVATGNLLVVFTAIRNSGGGVPTGATNGYVRLPVFEETDNVQLFGKIATSSGETPPTISFSGGVANADTSAQMIRLGGRWGAVENVVANARNQLNASAQDIAYPWFTPETDRCIVLYLGWKQDDWTSVATVSGGTEIGEPDTTTGDDQGIVWDYVIQGASRAHIPAASFVVTGGAAAISRTALVALRCEKQLWTVTRAVNGINKAQDPDTPIVLTNPARLAL